MDNPSRYIRLFDVEKYREIQPVIEGIKNRDAKAEDVIPVLEAARKIAETDDFIKYNDDETHIEAKYLRLTIATIEVSGISEWFDMLDKGENFGWDILHTVYRFICCPEFQWTTLMMSFITGTTIEYGDVYHSYNVCDLGLFDLLDSSDYAERLPMDIEKFGIITTIFNRDELEEINEVMEEDNFNLSKLELSSDREGCRWQKEYLEFYDDFNRLLKIVNLHPRYTLLNEDSTIAY
jgi:hypothetical protein